jgi:hypothetical protein
MARSGAARCVADCASWGGTDEAALTVRVRGLVRGRAVGERGAVGTGSALREREVMRRSVRSTLVTVAAALLAHGCSKTSEHERREAERATSEAEQRASETSLTSATLEGADDAREAEDAALRERADMMAAVRREQLAYRATIREALDALDADLSAEEGRDVGGRHGDPRVARREALKEDLLALDASTGQDWATLKARIDRHLDDLDARPAEATQEKGR